MKLKIMTIFLSLIVCSPVLVSQTPPFYHYTSSDGLAASSVSDIIQDRNGFIWFATGNGISKFDGHKFKNYSTIDGLNSNRITRLLEGTNGEIYIRNYEMGINIYSNGKISKYADQTDKNLYSSGLIMDGDQLYTYFAYDISLVKPENTVSIFNDRSPNTIGIYRMIKLQDNTILAATSDGLYKFEKRELKKVDVKELGKQELYWLSVNGSNNVALGAYGKIYEIYGNRIIRTIELDNFDKSRINCLLIDSRGNIWFSNTNKGFYMIEAGTSNIVNIGSKMGFENSVVSNFFEDNEGNIWVTTMGDGVFCLNNLYLKNYSSKDGLSNNRIVTISKDNSGRILIGALYGLNILDVDRIVVINHDEYIRYRNIININDTVYIAGLNSKNYAEISYKNDHIFLLNSSAILIAKDNKFISGGLNNDIYTQPYPPILNDGLKSFIFSDTITNNLIYDMFQDSLKNLWIGTTMGLCKITDLRKTFFPESIILSSPIKCITQDKSGRIWFAGDKGIASYDLKDSNIVSYSKFKDNDLVSSYALSVDKYNRLWIGSMSGLFILDKDSISVHNTMTGLPSNEIYSLYYDSTNNYMWVGSAQGLSSLDVSEFDNKKKIPVHVQIKNIKSQDSVYTNFDKIDFEPDQNNILIDFTAINYSSPGSVKYQYMLKDEWVDIPNDNVNFTALKRGSYNLAIRAKTINSSWGSPTMVSFNVLPYFTETLLFRTSIISLFLIGILFIFMKRIKHIKNKSKEKLEINNQINQLKHSALSAMMNPHFIFNSLNSVQYLINIDRKKEANDYISLMAKLIRMNLDSAAESYISLKEEIKRLELYLQIEKLRFSQKFSFEIFTGNNMDPDMILIPNMIIQPFVENSIWHGIMPSGRDGFIKLSFNFEDVSINDSTFKFFVIRITDNGIGITEARKNNKDGHVSKGIKIIQDRLILLSKERHLPRPIIEDINIKDKSTQGTEVVLSIPPDLYKFKNV